LLGVSQQITAFLGGHRFAHRGVTSALDMVQRIEANLLMRNYGASSAAARVQKGKRIKGRQY